MKLQSLFVRLAWFLVLGIVPHLEADPYITDFNPKLGSPGDTIYLSGNGFLAGGFTVRFWNNRPVTSGYVYGDTLMNVTVPTGVANGPLSIQQGSGSQNYTSTDFLAVGPGPYITGFSTNFGAVGDSILVNGVHFTGVSSVKFNGAAASSPMPSPDGTAITVRVPTGATTGLISVTVGQVTTNSPTDFIVIGSGPYVTGFSPAMGTPGTTVYISGRQFYSANATSASFNGTLGNNFAVQSDSQIRVDAPSGVTTGPISVANSTSSSTSSVCFYVPPTVTGVSPSGGRAGTNITISGTSFLGTTNVNFNGLAAASFTVLNNSNIQAAAPVGVSDGLIRVITPFFSQFSTSNFTVVPAIYGFSPSAGGVGTSVTVTGANFDAGGLVVRFNGTAAASVSGVSFGQLTALVPAGATTGPLSVTTTDGSDTNTTFFLPPSITSFTPTCGRPGTNVTVTGQNFLGATAVTFNGTSSTTYTVLSNSMLTAKVPAGVLTGPISVTAPAGTTASSALFYGPPAITNFFPTHGLPGDAVTIYGLNLTNASTLKFNGTNAVFSVVNNGTIQTTVPDKSQTGPIGVVTPGGTNVSTDNFVLDYTSDVAVFVQDSPDPVTVGSNLVYTIIIYNNGPFDAPNVRITNTLPSSVVLDGASTTQGSLTTNNAPANPVTGSLGTIAKSSYAQVTLTVTPQSEGTVDNYTVVTSDYPDPYPTNNTLHTFTTVLPAPLLSIQLLSPDQYSVSWPVALYLFGYALEYKNDFSATSIWTAFPDAPIFSNGQVVVTGAATNAEQFFRLRK